MGCWLGNTTLIYGEGLFSWDLSFGLTVESICSFLLGQIFGQLVAHSGSDWLLIFCSFYPPHMHFVRCFWSCARILAAIFAIWNMWWFLGKRKSFINIILSYDHTFRYYCSQVVTENDQTEAWSSFVTVEKCGADNKTNLKVSLLAWLFFMLLLSSADFSKLNFNKRLSATFSVLILVQTICKGYQQAT